MKKLILILLLLLTSCGARKVSKIEIKTIKDSTFTKVSVDTSLRSTNVIDTSYIVKDLTIDEIEVCPISDTIPIIVNGVVYKNARLKIKKTKDNTLYSNKKIVSEIEDKSSKEEVSVTKSEKIDESIKDIDRDNTKGFFIMIIFVVIIIYLIDRYGKNK
jgi:hypothetical protein